ncbi:MAG: hypothetical protein WCJ70_03955 [bacterium]
MIPTTPDFTDEEFKEIQLERHAFSQTYLQGFKELLDSQTRLEERSIETFVILLTSVGVIAGFGFTALSNVVNAVFFFVSEAILMFLIIYGLFVLPEQNKRSQKSLIHQLDYLHRTYSPRLDLYKRFLTLEMSKNELFEKLSKDDERVFNSEPKFDTKRIDLNKSFLIAMLLLIVGGALLILSFIGLPDKRTVCENHFCKNKFH